MFQKGGSNVTNESKLALAQGNMQTATCEYTYPVYQNSKSPDFGALLWNWSCNVEKGKITHED